MTLQQMRCVVAAAKYQSFHRAAEHLYITQPSVTHQIQQLERELGATLFDRTQRKTVLTEAGRLFYEDAVGILDRVELAAQRVRQASDGGTLIVISEEMIHFAELPRVLSAFHHEMPQVLLNMTEEDRAGIRNAAQKRIADVTIAPMAAFQDLQNINCVSLGRGQQYCVMPSEHPLAGVKKIIPSDLEGHTLIIPDTYHCPPELRQFFRSFQEQLREIRFCYAGSPRQAVDMVRAGLGIAFFPEFAIPDIHDLTAAPVECAEPVELAAAWHNDADHAAVRCFVRILRQVMQPEKGIFTDSCRNAGVR